MRTCTDCGETKDLVNFLRIAGTSGYYGRCRACRARRARERYHADPRVRAATIAGSSRRKQVNRRVQPREATAVPHAAARHVLKIVSGLCDVPVDVLLGRSRARRVIGPRAVAFYVLRTEAGLTAEAVGRLFGRSRDTVRDLSRTVLVEFDHHGPRAELANAARRRLTGSASNGAEGPVLARPRSSGGLLRGLAPARQAARLTQAQLASRAGIARETLGRLECLRRPADPATVRALAEALACNPSVLRDSDCRQHAQSERPA